ncbi:DUF2975 domain-containing protein [Paenibacillus soyae]|uniref:DUF2975 domain-containing protein n=1 Tax=Paenibacillus soyae TaxID=2969249 RepID=A0A9X2MVE9_9BACL|nr:DUF2975 domain-containing protein [Paenibacillus soyae]MCR2806598.1 DUF2975 domain-containing protein [Paenibacillus soyae]
MKQGSTLFLKGVVVLIGLAALAMCIFGLPGIANEIAEDYSMLVYLPLLIVVYAAAMPFFIALYQALLLLGYIDKNRAFSWKSVKALRVIKFCAMAISLLIAAGMPSLMIMAQKDDAPGLAGLGMVIIFASVVIAFFAAVLEKLLRNAIAIKSENDLTI